jgi:subtilisin-like proprotein convertase family protein
MAADQYLFAGTNRDVICAAMTERGILSDCLIAPRGEFTVYPGSGSGTIVPDNDPNGVALSAFISDTRAIERVTVSVDIRHRGRGELRVELIAPDGTVVRLHQPNPERAPDLITTFGRDSLPVDSLDVFRGRSAAGEWRLRVADVAFADVATVVFWSLNIQFEGAAPSPHRPEWNIHSYSAVVPVVGHAPGANGTFFRTDLRLAAGSEPSSATLVFTPSGRDGREDFAAVRIDLPAGRAVAIDDLVLRLFSSGGLGQLEILSSTPLSASTRTWTAGEAGTFGFSLPPSSRFVAITSAEPQYIGGLRTTSVFRTNLGFAEAHGQPVRVHVRLRSASATESFSIDLPPHSHAQVPVDFQADPFVAEVRVEGAGAVIAYGAVVDNGSGDPMVIPAVRAGTSSTFPAISSPGANGTNWRTEVTIVSVDAVRGQSTHTYFAGGDPGVRQEIEADFLRVEDAVASWFERPNTIGAVNSMLPPNLVVTARVWTDGPGGTYGQVVTGSGGWTILHIENSDAYRTNIGFHSISGGSVRATLLDADGRVVNTYLVELQPFQLVQFPITDRIVNGAVRIEALFDVSAYGSLVDNRTGDPTFIPAQ